MLGAGANLFGSSGLVKGGRDRKESQFAGSVGQRPDAPEFERPLVVRLRRLGNLLDDLADLRRLGLERHVRLREDADQPAVGLDHG